MDGLQIPLTYDPLALFLGMLLPPFLGALVNGLFGKRLGKEAVTLMALVAVGLPFVASLLVVTELSAIQQPGGEAARIYFHAWEWTRLSLGGPFSGGSIPIDVAFSVDALSGTMTLIITGIGFLIHLYSTKYMAADAGYHRFFAYLNLFIFSMLVLVLGDNLPVLFVGWEGVGLCSYLLIGFWFSDEKNAAAGKKAFITNRVGDFGLLIAMGLLVYHVGALDWRGMVGQRDALLALQELRLGPWTFSASAATLVGLALFLGCAGKSAQIPLHIWLPDAMAGPTPVSALIHAATMVTAGVYLVCRMAPILVLSPAAMFTIALVGAVTAFVAATIALVQNDIKKVLAYSTVSQLGYMFLGAGVGAFSAGFFHVITHAFFKACLFLGAGSVIHAMHARIHDTDASQDMRNMGGLRRYLPITFVTFAASWAAISGFPLTSGFFSKDEILESAFTSKVGWPSEGGVIGSGNVSAQLFAWPSGGPTLLYALGLAAAVMTAFYMSRLVIGTFLGEFRGWTIVKAWKPAHGDHGHDPEHDAEPAREGPLPHESPWQMTAPLVVLALFALGAGFFNAHLFHLDFFDRWLLPVFDPALGNVEALEQNAEQVPFLALAISAFLVGTGVAYFMYVTKRGEPARLLTEKVRWLHAFLKDKWRFDELYQETFVGAVELAADIGVWADKWIVDGVIARGSSFVVRALGSLFRFAQTGRVPTYAALTATGVLGIGWFLSAPHAVAVLDGDWGTGEFKLTATPGVGYRYRWDVDGDGEWDQKDFGANQSLTFAVPADAERRVRLEVKNGVGRTAIGEFAVRNPGPGLLEVTPQEARMVMDQAAELEERIGATRAGKRQGSVAAPNATGDPAVQHDPQQGQEVHAP